MFCSKFIPEKKIKEFLFLFLFLFRELNGKSTVWHLQTLKMHFNLSVWLIVRTNKKNIQENELFFMIVMIQLGIEGVFKVFPTIVIQTFAIDQ